MFKAMMKSPMAGKLVKLAAKQGKAAAKIAAKQGKAIAKSAVKEAKAAGKDMAKDAEKELRAVKQQVQMEAKAAGKELQAVKQQVQVQAKAAGKELQAVKQQVQVQAKAAGKELQDVKQQVKAAGKAAVTEAQGAQTQLQAARKAVQVAQTQLQAVAAQPQAPVPVAFGKRMNGGLRSFTLVATGSRVRSQPERYAIRNVRKGGRYISRTPAAAALKMHNKMCRVQSKRGVCIMKITLRETTRGSAKKEFSYVAVRRRIDVHSVKALKGRTVGHKTTIKATRAPWTKIKRGSR